MLADYWYGKCIFLIFLAVFTYDDLKTKTIDMRMLWLFYLVIFTVYSYMLAAGMPLAGREIILGLFSGGIIYLAARGFRFIGRGDGLFFMGSGALLGWRGNLSLLVTSLLVISIYALGLMAGYMFQGKSIRGKTVAMLPFITLACFGNWFFGG